MKRNVFTLLCTLSFYSVLHSQNIENTKNKEPFEIKGRVGASMVSYHVDGRKTNRPEFTWMLVGNPIISIYGITFPFSLTVSEQHRSFQQPFNRYGVSPTYKWTTLHLGYRNVSFSPYTLGGHTMLGAGGEFTPGKFRIGMMYGRLLKPVRLATDLSGQPVTSQIPSYKRVGFSMKLGYGTNDNFVDMIYLKAKDRIGSITEEEQKIVLPGENAVISIVTKQKFLKKFDFQMEFSNSIYTKDIRVEQDSGVNVPSLFAGLVTQNSTTTHSKAIESSVAYNSSSFDFKVRFKHIDPGYRSMGTYFMQNDLQNITLEPTVKLLKSKYTLGGSLGFQHDNLKNSKAQQTNRVIGALNISANLVKWYRLNMSYSNYGINQRSGLYEIDTLVELTQTTNSLNLTQNFNVQGKKFMQNFVIVYNKQSLRDKNSNTAKFSEYTNNTLMGTYVLSYIPLRLNVTLTYNYTQFELPSVNTTIMGPVISCSGAFLKNKLMISLSKSNFANYLDDVRSSTINTFVTNFSYRHLKNHMLKFSFYVNKNKALNSSLTNVTEQKGELGYAYVF